eukprot:1161047-Pelagomonas_calceolata.AAC.13
MDQMEDVRKMYDTLMAQMSEYQEEQVNKWCARVATISEVKLEQSLLTKEDDRLCVNFDPLLVRLLRETKYFLLLKGIKCLVSFAGAADYSVGTPRGSIALLTLLVPMVVHEARARATSRVL